MEQQIIHISHEQASDWPWGVRVQPGREYALIYAACPGCEARHSVQPGHSQCRTAPIPMGWAEELPPVLMNAGWYRLISDGVTYSLNPTGVRRL